MAGLRSFALNPKCLAISGILGGMYWYLPPKDLRVLFSIVVGAYFAVAWYDELYDVPPERRLKEGFLNNLPGYSSLKPPSTIEQQQPYPEEQTVNLCG